MSSVVVQYSPIPHYHRQMKYRYDVRCGAIVYLQRDCWPSWSRSPLQRGSNLQKGGWSNWCVRGLRLG